MATTRTAKSALPYLQRLLEDEYVQGQLRDAAVALRSAYSRASKKRAGAADDKQLYGSLRRAATSIRDPTMALRQPEPPPKHRGRTLLIVGLAVGGAVILTRLGRRQRVGDAAADINDSSEDTA